MHSALHAPTDWTDDQVEEATLTSPLVYSQAKHSQTNPARPAGIPDAQIRVSEVISALSFALDLTEGQPVGHSVRSCVIGMAIAKEIALPMLEQGDLYYALLMKDAGCSTNASRMFQILGTDDIAAKRDVKTTDWTRLNWESVQYALSHVKTGAPFLDRVRTLFQMARTNGQTSQQMIQIRCERGAAIAQRMGLSKNTAEAILSLDEHWNGLGHPQGLRSKQIPLLSRIMNLAQTAEVFFTARGPAAALQVAQKRSGRWFDPDLVRALLSAARRESFWNDVENANERVTALEPQKDFFPADDATLDNICLAFADVIDAKSPFTFRHSTGVAGAAVATGRALGMTQPELVLLRRAALLHDIGKLSVSNAILDKPGKLTGEEWDVVKKHPFYSHAILKRIPGFVDLSEIAASHHEKLDGSGYFRGIDGEGLSLPARILVVADIYDALAAKRPYRDALPLEKVFGIMDKDAPKALDAACLDALKCSTADANSIANSLLSLSLNVEQHADHRPINAYAPSETNAPSV